MEDQGAADNSRPHRGNIAGPGAFLAARLQRWAQVLAAGLVLNAVLHVYRFHADHGLGIFAITGPDTFPVVASVTVAALALSAVLIRPMQLSPRRLILLSAVWSLILLLALVVTWYLIDHTKRDYTGLGETVTSPAAVDRVLAAQAIAIAPGELEPIRVPTGVFVESIEMTSANNVQISAFIWMRFPADFPPNHPHGFTVPGATSLTTDALDTYTVPATDGATLMGWRAHFTIRQPHDYRNFPFDRQDVWFRIWPVVLDRTVVLVPDFASYTNLDPATLPGLSSFFVGAGWTPEHTFFTLYENTDNVSFGFPVGETPRRFTELVFNIGLKRDFVEPFLDDVLLAIVVAVLLFAVVVLNAQDMDRRTRFGITTFGVLGTAGTLLFTVLTKHNQIRSVVTPGQIVYIEILPILLYVTILLSVANAILLLAAPPERIRFLTYEDNLLPDVIYWPALLGTLWVVTMLVFAS